MTVAPEVGVLVMSHGTPTSIDQVEPFYTEIRRGRPPTAEQLADLVRRYEAIGGTSPLNELTSSQVSGIAASLERSSPGRWLVAPGAKFADPRIEDAARELIAAGVSRIIGIALAPHSSTVSIGDYEKRARSAISDQVSFEMVDHWYDAPGLDELLATRVKTALSEITAGGTSPEDVHVLFTAHSVPTRVVSEGDTYPDQVGNTASKVAGLVGLPSWSVAWQSAGRTPEPWVGPDILEVIASLPESGARAVVICPVGFVSDHLEVLFDVDIEAKAAADKAGLLFGRTESFNDDSQFLNIIGDVIEHATNSTSSLPDHITSGPVARRPRIVVVGGGISGLAAAWELTRSATEGTEIRVMESSDRVGGKIKSADLDGRKLDVGPDAFLVRRPEALELCRQLGIDAELVEPGSRSSLVWARGRLRRLPDGLVLGVPSRLIPLARSGILGPFGLMRAAVDLLIPKGKRDKAVNAAGGAPGSTSPNTGNTITGKKKSVVDISVGDTVRRRLGAQVEARLADPLIGGIHASSARTLSAAATFPGLISAQCAPGSLMRNLRPPKPVSRSAGDGSGQNAKPPAIFMAPRTGVSDLVDRLERSLLANGVEISTHSEVSSIAPNSAGWTVKTTTSELEADAVVIALPAPEAARLLGPHQPQAAELIGEVEQSSVSVVTMIFKRQDVTNPLDGTGFLIPAETGLLTTGCTWLSSKWPNLATPGEVIIRGSAGRFGDDRASELDDQSLSSRVLHEISAILGISGPPLATNVTRYPDAFPQYRPGHLLRMAAVEASLDDLSPIALAGATYSGVGIPACIGSGRKAASRVIRLIADRAEVQTGGR